ncbi:hypothetical protein WMF39_11490 [Sorangium sp. So ce1504]|uniref:hypothetical protein n=1 Tax=Sorangium sp. So ce1504 TaxID=3133337 RepID=UPI003F5D7AAD
MEINKKSRTELKAYFVKNALPTAGNFSDLIDAALNQKDDGLVKSADQPVQIAASTVGDKPAIHLYESFATDTKPAWVLGLQAGGKKGLGIGDGDGKNRLFIDGATGGVGIGTADPAGYKLRVAGSVLVDGADGKARLSFGSSTGQVLNLYDETYGIGVQSNTVYFRSYSNFAFYKGGTHSGNLLDPGTGGTAMLVIKDGKVGIGMTTPLDGLSLASGLALVFGADDTNRETSSGTIAYKRWSRGLDIVGAGDGTDVAKRQITFFAEGGSKFTGKVEVNGTLRSTMWNVSQIITQRPGALPVSDKFQSSGGTLLLLVSGSAFRTNGGGRIQMDFSIDGNLVGTALGWASNTWTHYGFIAEPRVVKNIAAGIHTIRLAAGTGDTATDGNDFYSVTVLELPF